MDPGRRKRKTVFTCFWLASIASSVLGCEPFQPDQTSDAVYCEQVNDHYCYVHLETWNTSYPNMFNHTNYLQASRFLDRFQSLFESECSEQLFHFICFAAFPLCFPGQFHKVEPCRELCVAVREGCSAWLSNNGREWPAELDCNQFPAHGSKICVWHGSSLCDSTDEDSTTSSIPTEPPISTTGAANPLANCTSHLVRYPEWSIAYYGGVSHCEENCHGVYLTTKQQSFTLVWITIWSLLCLLTSVITFLTCLLNFKQIQSPESPVYCIALCYAFVALAYTISIAIGKEKVICDGTIKNKLNESALVADGIRFPLCWLMFSVLYYFTLSSWMWWAVLNLEWLVCSVRSHSIGTKWRICSHFVSWGVPVVFLTVTLGTKVVGGDPVLRTCWIRKHNELPFLIIPLLAVVIFSCVVIMIAFSRVTSLQRTFKESHRAQSDIARITGLIQVGLYCTVFLLPMGILLCCYWYEYWYREQWEQSYLECVNNSVTCTTRQRPLFTVLMTKFAVSLAMGIISVMWVLRRSSLRAWRKVCCVCYSAERGRADLHTMRQLAFTGERYMAEFSSSETSV